MTGRWAPLFQQGFERFRRAFGRSWGQQVRTAFFSKLDFQLRSWQKKHLYTAGGSMCCLKPTGKDGVDFSASGTDAETAGLCERLRKWLNQPWFNTLDRWLIFIHWLVVIIAKIRPISLANVKPVYSIETDTRARPTHTKPNEVRFTNVPSVRWLRRANWALSLHPPSCAHAFYTILHNRWMLRCRTNSGHTGGHFIIYKEVSISLGRLFVGINRKAADACFGRIGAWILKNEPFSVACDQICSPTSIGWL